MATSKERDGGGPLAGLASTAGFQPREPVSLDETDRRILRVLAQDSRTSQRRIASEIGMSAPTVGERIARLERLGVIKGYTISVDWALIGYPVLIFLSVAVQHGADLVETITALSDIDELEEVAVVTGGTDFLVRCRVRDHDHLRAVLLRIWQSPGVLRTETVLSLGEVSNSSAFVTTLVGPGDINERKLLEDA